MEKSKLFYATVFLGLFSFMLPCWAVGNELKQPLVADKEKETRADAVIYKIHDIEPTLVEGVVKGCDFMITIFNRSSINFRTFTLNLDWQDSVDEAFKFDRYVETLLGHEAYKQQKDLLNQQEKLVPMKTAITVNAFGAGKQLSLKHHINSEKCYLMLSVPNFTVTPCDIVHSVNAPTNLTNTAKENSCTNLFQYVSTDNPEYYGQFQQITATEEVQGKVDMQNRELTDIDTIIKKIVENIDVSDKTLAEIK